MGEYLVSKYGEKDGNALNFGEFVKMINELWNIHSIQRQEGCEKRITKNI